jgi:hypothetical protein
MAETAQLDHERGGRLAAADDDELIHQVRLSR